VIATADFPFGKVQARGAMLTPSPMVRAAKERPGGQPRDEDVTRLVDGTLEDSFPASDPPSWTASIVRLAPAAEVSVRTGHAGPTRPVQRAAALS
jgi:hypothetical protein